MKKETDSVKPVARLRAALATIRGYAREIVDVAADPSRQMSELFSEAAIQAKTNACLELALSVAACKSRKPFREVHDEVRQTQDAVVAADNALAPYVTIIPEAMSNVMSMELKVFDWLLTANPVILALAKLTPVLKPYVASYLHKEFTSLRFEILLHESGGLSAPGAQAQIAKCKAANESAHAAIAVVKRMFGEVQALEVAKEVSARSASEGSGCVKAGSPTMTGEKKSEAPDILDINEEFEKVQAEKMNEYVRARIREHLATPTDEMTDIPIEKDVISRHYRKMGFEDAGLTMQEFATFTLATFDSYLFYFIDRADEFIEDMIEEYRDKTEDEKGMVTERTLLPHLIYENAKFARRVRRYMGYFRGECEWTERGATFSESLYVEMEHFLDEFALVCETFGSSAMRAKYLNQLRRVTAAIDIVVDEIKRIFPSDELDEFGDQVCSFSYAFLYADEKYGPSFVVTKDRVRRLRAAADDLVRRVTAQEREFNLKRNQERFACPANVPEKIAEAVHAKMRPDIALLQEGQQVIREEVGGVKRSLLGKVNEILRRNRIWDGIVSRIFREKRIPRQEVVAAVNDRYSSVDWTKFKHKDGVRQIKDVIDYTYDVKPITMDVSGKNLKASGGITLADACNRAAILHNKEWSTFKDPFPTPKGLYVACYDLAHRARESNPFKTTDSKR